MSRPIAAVVVVGAALVVSACSGNGSAEPSSTSPASSTAASTSTSTATSSTTTTLAPTTTTTSAEQALDAETAKVEAAYRAVEAAHLNALTVLDGYDPATIRAVIAPGPLLDGELKQIDDFRNQGRRVKPNNPQVSGSVVESLSLASAKATTASLTVCAGNNNIVYEPGLSPGPEDDVIIDDSQQAIRERWDMVKEAGTWLAERHEVLGTWPGRLDCPSA